MLTHSVPLGYGGHPIRRAQALAIANGLDIALARDLIGRKLDGQRANLMRLRVTDLHAFDAFARPWMAWLRLKTYGCARLKQPHYIGMRGRACQYGYEGETYLAFRQSGRVMIQGHPCLPTRLAQRPTPSMRS